MEEKNTNQTAETTEAVKKDEKKERKPLVLFDMSRDPDKFNSDAKVQKIFNILMIVGLVIGAAGLALYFLLPANDVSLLLLVAGIVGAAAFVVCLPFIRIIDLIVGLGFANVWMKLENKWPTIFQFIRFWIISNITTVFDYIFTLLFLNVFFAGLGNIDGVVLGFEVNGQQVVLLGYTVINGGLKQTLTYYLSYVIVNTFNFFAQRKYAFNANNNVWISAMWYVVTAIIVFLITGALGNLEILLPGVFNFFNSNVLGQIVYKFLFSTIAMWIFFFMNKFVIMRNVGEKKEENTEKAE